MCGAIVSILHCGTRSSTSMCRSILGFLPRTVPVRQYPPQLQLDLSASIRNHHSMITHRAEGVQYLTSGPYETGRRGRDYRDVLVACPEVRYCAASAPTLIKSADACVASYVQDERPTAGIKRLLNKTTANYSGTEPLWDRIHCLVNHKTVKRPVH